MENGHSTKRTNGQYLRVKLEETDHPKVQSLAVQMSNVYYTYDRPSKDKFVLKGININILKGEIYALLGPSGCGKTTILRCITTTIKPFRGRISLPLNQTKETKIPGPGVGYMPQELTLFTDLTIGETLWLFGSINGAPVSNLRNKIHELKTEFELPNLNRYVGTLSGGQKRRVSLLAAFIREPQLLILDEPTVGVDPILRKKIWEYMIRLVNEGTTILLTTHYIDEAKDATTVGLMREGKIIAELSPFEILNLFQEKSLERCFYLMCVKNETQQPSEKIYHRQIQKTEVEVHINNTNEKYDDGHTMTVNHRHINSNMTSLILKNLKQLSRNPLMLFYQFVLPALTVAVFGICIGKKVFDIHVAICNEEDTPHYSAWFLESLNSYPFKQQFFHNLEEAKDSVRRGDNAIAIHIPKDFTVCLRNKLVLRTLVDNTTVTCGSIHLHMDTTNQIISLDMHLTIYKAFQKLQIKILDELDSTPLLANIPIVFQKPVYGSMDVQFSEYITPCMLLTCSHFFAMVLTGFSLLLEKLSGIVERLEISGVSRFQILCAQLITNFMVVAVQVVLMLSMQFTVFETKIAGNMIHLILLLFLQGFCGMLLGFFLSVVVDKIATGVFLGLGAFFSNIIMSGVIWPLQGMSIYMQWLARIIPVTLNGEALRGVLSKGFGLESRVVWLGYVSVILHSAFFLIGAILIFKYKK